MSAPDTEEGSGPRKGRGNAILTYETVSELDNKLTRVDAKLDALVENQGRHEVRHEDHESRIRTLEAQVVGFLAGYAATSSARIEKKSDFQWVWGALMAALGACLAVFSVLHK